MPTSPDLVVRVSTNISALQDGMSKSAAEVQKLGDAAKTATNPFSNLHAAAEKFDGVLAVGGVHIREELHGLADLGDAAGKSAGQIGALGTAGLVLGAGIAGWKVGRMIADFFGLDESIGKATASLLGYGDVAAQVAGAKQDSINLAIKRGADAAISYAEALRFNLDWVKHHTEGLEKSIKAHEEWAAAMVEVNAAGKGWQGTLQTIDGETVNAIRYYLEAGVSQGALAKAYALTDVQVKAVVSSMDAEKQTLKEKIEFEAVWAKFHVDTLTMAAEHERQWAAESKRILDLRNKAVMDGFSAIRTEEQRLHDFEDQTWMDATSFQVKKVWELADQKIKSFQGTDEQRAKFASITLQAASAEADRLYEIDAEMADKTKAKLDEVAGKIQEVAKLSAGVLSGDIAKAYGAQYGASLDQLALTPGSSIGFGKGPGVQSTQSVFDMRAPGRASGGDVMAGRPYWVGERGPELMVPSTSGTIVPNGGAGNTHIHIYVTQPLGTPQQIADVVGPALLAKWRGQGGRTVSA